MPKAYNTKEPTAMYLEFDWTFNVYRARLGGTFTDIRGERSFPTLRDADDALRFAGLFRGEKTDSRTWRIRAAIAGAA